MIFKVLVLLIWWMISWRGRGRDDEFSFEYVVLG